MTQILPVIHHLDNQTTLEEVLIAEQTGADGVFLISHSGNDIELLNLGSVIAARHPDFWLGINMLNTPPVPALREVLDSPFDGIWMDNVGVHSTSIEYIAYQIRDLLQSDAGMSKELFGAVAFKYQRDEANPVIAALCAQALGFLPTTSGSGTGSAPDVKKIASMSEATGNYLACASGMTPENIRYFAPYLSHVLVSTGISDDFYHINPEKLKMLIVNSKSINWT